MTPPDNYGEKPRALTTQEKQNWNKFLDFVEANGMKNNPILDQRNKGVGLSLLQKFNFANPKNALSMDIVPRVQQDIHDYRDSLIKQWKAGKIEATPDIKSEADIMPQISPVDGWPGTKTLSHRFPVATATIKTPEGTVTKDYGVDTQVYDKDRGIAGSK